MQPMTKPNNENNHNFLSQKITGSDNGLSTSLVQVLDKSTTKNNDAIDPSKNSNKRTSDSCGSPKYYNNWQLEANTIPMIPRYYPLVRTAFAVKNTPVHIISSRITDFLRRHSIMYSTGESELFRLNCSTSSMLKFTIQFWREQPQDDPNNKMIVELNRRQGSTMEMQNIRRAIAQELLYGKQTEITHSYPGSPLLLEGLVMADVDNQEYMPSTGQAWEAANICQNLLESQCLDQVLLGLESLSSLTDRSTTCKFTTKIVSYEILRPRKQFGKIAQGRLAECIANSVVGHGVAHGGSCFGKQGPWHIYARILGLKILRNALQEVSDAPGTTSDVVNSIDFSSYFLKRATESFIWNIESAAQRPNEAALSANCIRLLNEMTRKNNIGPLMAMLVPPKTCLDEAAAFGRAFHLCLETEAMHLMAAMDIEDNYPQRPIDAY